MIRKLSDLFDKAKNHEGLKRYGKNTAWLMAEKVLRMFVGLFVGIWIARYLGPEQFGLLSYAQSFVFLFTAIATLGLDGIVVRELVKDESKRDVLLGTAFTLKLIGAFLIFPLLWLGVQLTNNDVYTSVLVFIIASATVFQSFNVIDFYYQSTVMSKYVALSNSFSLLLSSIIKIILIFHNAPLIAFALMFVFDTLALSFGLVYFYVKKTKLRLFTWSFNKKVATQLLADSWPLIISSIMISLYMRIDQIMIKEILDSNAVGQYAAAVRLSEAWYFLPLAICSSVFPAIVNAKKVNEELYYQRLQKLYSLMVYLGIAVALPATFGGSWIINMLYGYAYAEASSVLMVHVWAGVFVCIGVANNLWLINENLQIHSMINTTIGAVTNVILTYYLVVTFNIIGAAIATFISYFVSAYLLLAFHKKTRDGFFLINKSILGFR